MSALIVRPGRVEEDLEKVEDDMTCLAPGDAAPMHLVRIVIVASHPQPAGGSRVVRGAEVE
jgi:hypothetical protein